MKKPFYITTTLPYVNNDPHAGFAMEIIRADVIARYKKQQGFDVFFNTGTDEHGQKLFAGAQKEGIAPQEYVDRYAARFKLLLGVDGLSISPDVHFVRTTDAHHIVAAQAFWMRCFDNGYIYKKNYQTKYCVGCELEKTDSELNEDSQCPLHPGKDLEIIDEENYFFAYSKLEDKLAALYAQYPDLVIPEFRFNEMKAFLSRGLQDFSISRLKEKMSWGIPVPNDDAHVMYVWFDALVNYISTLGWPENTEQFERFWRDGAPVQYCGKDNTRQQASMWQAMLLAADLPPTRHIIINGFINSNGQKMSKSLGNVIHPMVARSHFSYCVGESDGLMTDILRYYLLRHVQSFEDSDMTMEHMENMYDAGLANGLGNLVSRIMTLSEAHCQPFESAALAQSALPDLQKNIDAALDVFDTQKAIECIWTAIGALDAQIAEQRPFSVIKEDKEKGVAMITDLVAQLHAIAVALQPFMPTTAEKIAACIAENKKPATPLFTRFSSKLFDKVA